MMDMQYVAMIISVAYMLPIGWLFYLLRQLNSRVDNMQKGYYDKAETKEMIELHVKPIVQAVQNVKDDTVEIKQLIGKLFDAQQKTS